MRVGLHALSVCPRFLSFQGRQRHPDAQVVAGRVVIVPSASFIPAVDADAVKQVAVVLQSINQGFALEEIVRDFRQVLRSEFVQLCGIMVPIVTVCGQSDSDA